MSNFMSFMSEISIFDIPLLLRILTDLDEYPASSPFTVALPLTTFTLKFLYFEKSSMRVRLLSIPGEEISNLYAPSITSSTSSPSIISNSFS